MAKISVALGRQGYLLKYICLLLLKRTSKSVGAELPSVAGFYRDAIGSHISVFGVYEWPELRLLERLLNEIGMDGMIALDVGANIGNHTISLFQRRFSEVHCLEPNPVIFQLLKFNLRLFENCQCHQIGLSDEPGEACMTWSDENWGSSAIVMEPKASGDKAQARLEKMDDYCAFMEGRIGLIKLDVEGHEANVLRGGLRTIDKNRPIITFEHHGEASKSSEVLTLLQERDYTFYIMKDNVFLEGFQNYLARGITAVLHDVLGRTIKLKRVIALPEKFCPMVVAVPAELGKKL